MSSSQGYNFLREYSGNIALALILTTLFYNVYLIFKIRYGSILITKMSLWPYYYSLAYLTACALNTYCKCIEIWTAPDEQYEKAALNIWNNVGADPFIAFIRILDSVEILCFILFISSRAYIVAILYEFMMYQSQYRLEDLDLAKEHFNRMERRAQSLTIKVFVTYATLVMSLTIINCAVLIKDMNQYMSIVYYFLLLGGYLVVLRIYLYYRINNYRLMKQKHFDAH